MGPRAVLQAEDLWKEYRLGVISHQTLARDLQSWWARSRGKEDPNSPVAIAQAQQAARRSQQERFWALQDVSFQVNQGDIVGVIGRNGAGKSTLLKILSQVTAPTRGEVRIKGRIASLLEVGTGFHPELTGRENIFLNGAILGMSKADIRQRLDEIVTFAEVEKFIDTPVKRYSSGMFVRLAFAVAAHLEPEILIIDEVLAVGDVQFQKKCLGKMEQSRKEGRTLLFVSHNMGVVSGICDKTILLKEGRVACFDETARVVREYLTDFTREHEGACRTFEESDRPFNVTAISLLNGKGQPATSFVCDEAVTLLMEVTVRKRIPGLYGYLALLNGNHEKVLVSDSFDAGENPLEAVEPGRHQLEIAIPARTVGHGNYSITIDFASPQSEYQIGDSISVETLENVLSFSLDDCSTVRGNTREGYLSTIPSWKMRKKR